MKNREKFAKEILDIACNGGVIAVTKDNKVVCCRDINCEQCLFHKTNYYESYCDYEATMRWAESEYVEKKPTITSREKNFLDALLLLSNCYIARDKDNSLYVYYDKPIRGNKLWISDYACHDLPKDMYGSMFDFIKWEDEEPWSVEDLKKLEVKNE